jgi:transposase
VATLILGVSPEEGVLMGRPSKFSPEFREQAVELVRATGKTIAEGACLISCVRGVAWDSCPG